MTQVVQARDASQQKNGWIQTTLGEVAVLNYGKGLVAENRSHGKIPVYGSSGITGWHNEPLVRERGLIIGRKGTVGAIYKSETPFYPIDTVYYITKNDTPCDLDFLYNLLLNLRLDKMNSDSAVPGLNRENAYAKSILLPPLSEQRAIAAILWSLDDKIELLREQNKTLEDLAQTIFHEWCGKYKVSDELPEGWRVGKLSEIADFLNGLALQKFPSKSEQEFLPVIKIRELKAGITDQTDKASTNIPQKYIVNNGDILFSWSGSLEVVIWKHGKGALNQHLFKVTSDKYPKWFYYFWILAHLPQFQALASAKATTMGHIQRHHLDEALVYIPTDDFMKKANLVFSPILEKIILNNSQIQTLSTLRDGLLPILVSGHLNVGQ